VLEVDDDALGQPGGVLLHEPEQRRAGSPTRDSRVTRDRSRTGSENRST
jgi:hypothetical protein